MDAADVVDVGRQRRRRLIRASAATLAASGVLAASAAFIMARSRTSHHATAPVSQFATTAAGEHKSVRLGDGTVIQLAPASTIRWSESRDRREVELAGLADFRVVHDSPRPFTVHARGAQITDIGTEFVVRAYEGDSATRVSVLSGIVGLARRAEGATASAADTATVTLRAGDVGIVATSRAIRLMNAPGFASDSAWMRGALSFENARLGDVVIELQRWFGANIRIDNPALACRRVTAIYAQPQLPTVLDAIAATVGATVMREGSSYRLRVGGRQ
jgi:transmembrane sensor